MTARITATLAAIVRPALVVSGALLATGLGLGAAGVAAGWPLYLAGYASLAVTLPALAVVHGDRLGRFGRVAFGIATVNAIVGTPVVAMVTTFMLRLDALHLALMPYAVSPLGVVAAYGMNVSIVLVGIAIVRGGVVPARAGWLLVGAAVLEYPVEFGLFPFAVGAVAMIIVAVAFAWIARSIPAAPAARRTAGPSDEPVGQPA